jgi:hypothetical protein
MSGFRLQLKIFETVVVLVLIFVMNNVARRDGLSGFAPPDDLMLVCVSAAISPARILRRSDDQDVRSIPQRTSWPAGTRTPINALTGHGLTVRRQATNAPAWIRTRDVAA